MDKKKIAIIDYAGPKSGTGHSGLSLLRAAIRLGADAAYFSNAVISEEGIKTTKVFSGKKLRGLRKFTDYIRGHKDAFATCKRRNADVVILYHGPAGFRQLLSTLLAAYYKQNILLVVQDTSSILRTRSTWIGRFIFGNAKRIIVNNEFSRNEILSKIPESSRTKTHTIPQGSFINIINPFINKREARQKLGLWKNEKIILFFGQIKESKGLDILLQALPLTSSTTRLIIAGNSKKSNFERYHNEVHNLRVSTRVDTNVRHVSEEDRELLFKAADVVVLPYNKTYKSRVLLMAMSYALPVIASDLPPFREIIQHGWNGLLFRKNDALDLAKQINTIIGDDKALQSLGEAARETMDSHFSWNRIAGKYMELIPD